VRVTKYWHTLTGEIVESLLRDIQKLSGHGPEKRCALTGEIVESLLRDIQKLSGHGPEKRCVGVPA